MLPNSNAIAVVERKPPYSYATNHETGHLALNHLATAGASGPTGQRISQATFPTRRRAFSAAQAIDFAVAAARQKQAV
jgi:hypothetical protein